MKKNKMMRIASFLLVAVLMSTCAISGTFAKYVTADTATDSARVAKWGVTVTTTGTLFADAYKDIPVTYSATDRDGTITVRAATESANVVAPGTKNETGMKFVLTGTLSDFSRDEASKIIEKLGGETVSSVSKKTDVVLAGESAGSKLDKAKALGIEIMTEETFKSLIKDLIK